MKDLGQMRHRLTLEKPAGNADGAGGTAIRWIAIANLWGAIDPHGGSEPAEDGRRISRQAHTITIRYRRDIAPTMRFRLGARLFHITAIAVKDGKRRFLACSVEERAP
jgi:SPP1 family predicted phage head-tail adaptor